MNADATILIATDSVTDAALVKDLVIPEFQHVFVSIDPDKLPRDFKEHQPSVLILAFNTLEKSERYYLDLYRLCKEVHQYPHRTVILCNKKEVKRAFELCMKEKFDDYVLFWPMTYDMSRLTMSVYHALRELAVLKSNNPSAAEFAAQARGLAGLENTLDRQMEQGGQHIETASRALEQVEQKIDSAIDGFSKRFILDPLTDSGVPRSADDLKNEISRFKREEIHQHFLTAAETIQPLNHWARELQQECEPHMESVRVINAMAKDIWPVVLVVDDDELQLKIFGKLLEAENYRLIFAGDAFEALRILHKSRVDVVLMDVMMPNMDGLETTRKLKTIPQFAKIPVIMITGMSKGRLVVDSLKAGAVDFVVKPCDRVTLIAKIAHALGKKAS